MDVDDESPAEIPILVILFRKSLTRMEDFVAGLAQITGDKGWMDVAVVAKESEHIAASIADDEWMQHRQDLITYQERGPPAAGRGSSRCVILSGRGRGTGRSSKTLIDSPQKVCVTSCDCASKC